MTAWIVIGICGAACYLMRIAPVELLGRIEPREWLDRVAVLSAPVAFTTLAVAALAGAASDGFAALCPRIAAVLVAAVVAHRTHSTAGTIGAGMVTLWVASAVL